MPYFNTVTAMNNPSFKTHFLLFPVIWQVADRTAVICRQGRRGDRGHFTRQSGRQSDGWTACCGECLCRLPFRCYGEIWRTDEVSVCLCVCLCVSHWVGWLRNALLRMSLLSSIRPPRSSLTNRWSKCLSVRASLTQSDGRTACCWERFFLLPFGCHSQVWQTD